jgi:hypothetical protein
MAAFWEYMSGFCVSIDEVARRYRTERVSGSRVAAKCAWLLSRQKSAAMIRMLTYNRSRLKVGTKGSRGKTAKIHGLSLVEKGIKSQPADNDEMFVDDIRLSMRRED